jgi:hypothetical protein
MAAKKYRLSFYFSQNFGKRKRMEKFEKGAKMRNGEKWDRFIAGDSSPATQGKEGVGRGGPDFFGSRETWFVYQLTISLLFVLFCFVCLSLCPEMFSKLIFLRASVPRRRLETGRPDEFVKESPKM